MKNFMKRKDIYEVILMAFHANLGIKMIKNM